MVLALVAAAGLQAAAPTGAAPAPAPPEPPPITPSVAGDCFAQDLGGGASGATAWTVLSANRSVAIAASVPGQVHLDLMSAGLIGDPYADNATLAQQWVRDEAWTFERDFAVDTRLAACAHVLLVADGLDTLATVVVDGVLPPPWTPTTELQNQIPADRLNFTTNLCADAAVLLRRCAAACTPPCVGFTTGNPPPATCCWLYNDVPSLQNSTDGNWWPAPPPPPMPAYTFDANDMFLRYSWDVTGAIRTEGAHNLSVSFRSVSGTDWPSVRKEADSWGYDWAPVTQTQGIWQPLMLVGVNAVAITHIVPRIRAVPDNPTAPLADGNNSFECSVDVVLYLPQPASISVEAVGEWGTRSSTTLSLPEGESTITLVLGAEDVPLWWPHTHGAQALFVLNVTAIAVGSSAGASMSRRVGFRSVALIANASSVPLRQFYRVNGAELFVMGADWVPADAFQARLDEPRLRDLLQSVVAANMNLLRIWGGGIYMPGIFYDICDELGVMVHSEGQFSDGDYEDSADAARLALIAAEALHQARRLASHPSVIVWVGNNENAPPGDPSNWVNFYLRHFLDVVATADSSRPVWPLCPAFPWAAGVDPASGLPNGDPLQLSRTGYSGPPWEGHVYFFDLCATPETCRNCVDDSMYPPTTYASEFGWVGAPSFETLAPALTGGLADLTLTSPGMVYRQNTIVHMDKVYNMVRYNFGDFAAPVVDTASVPAFRHALHLSMLAQADCLRAEVEHYRRGRNGPDNTHGTMFWMLDAFWPSPSWDSLEYGGRWKMLHYAARDFYNAIALDAFCSPSITNCSSLVVHVGSELLAPVNATVRLEIVRFADGGGGGVAVAEWPAPLAGPGAGLFFDVPSTVQLVTQAGCMRLNDCIVLVHAVDAASGEQLRPPALRSLTLWANATLPAVTISVTSLGGGNFSVAAAGGVAPHTMVHAETLGHFLPNNLLLMPGQPLVTSWVPGPGGAAEPEGVYAVSINGGSASLATTSWQGAADLRRVAV